MSLPRWSPDELASVVSAGRPLVVDVRADWCTQCGPQEQVLERIAPEFAGSVDIVSVDVGEHPDFVDRYGIQTLPSFLLFAAGEHRRTITGFRRAPELREAVHHLLAAAS